MGNSVFSGILTRESSGSPGCGRIQSRRSPVGSSSTSLLRHLHLHRHLHMRRVLSRHRIRITCALKVTPTGPKYRPVDGQRPHTRRPDDGHHVFRGPGSALSIGGPLCAILSMDNGPFRLCGHNLENGAVTGRSRHARQ
jgi:hypothetical protein